MKTAFVYLIYLLLICPISVEVYAHEGHHHHGSDNDTIVQMQKNTVTQTTIPTADKIMNPTGFVTFHPLVVHFPIVLLIIAALMQFVGLFYTKNNWDYIILFLLAGGALGAYLAGSFFHPHTEGLSHQAHEILKRHELFATLTLISSVTALFFKIVSIFLLKSRKKMFDIITAIILIVSAMSVSEAGHWGAHLTHIEGVGPQGKYIERE